MKIFWGFPLLKAISNLNLVNKDKELPELNCCFYQKDILGGGRGGEGFENQDVQLRHEYALRFGLIGVGMFVFDWGEMCYLRLTK